MKPIHKFNGGLGATLCHRCSVIITVGLTDDLYCERCIHLQNKTMSQLTAVDWLVTQLSTMGYIYAPHFGKSIIDKTIKKAKEKEKDQITTAYKADRHPCSDEDAEQYYNETYGKE